jgi:nicotinamide riboside kinase
MKKMSMHQSKNVLIIGKRQTGKTTLANHLVTMFDGWVTIFDDVTKADELLTQALMTSKEDKRSIICCVQYEKDIPKALRDAFDWVINMR